MIRVVCVGALKSPWAREGCAEFLQRIQRFGRCEVIEVADRGPSAEAPQLRAAASSGPLWACDPGGEALDTEAFAGLLGSHGGPNFLVGGPDGLDRELVASADRRLSLAPFTLPHELARLVLLEQVYRGLSLRAGHPYHR